MEILEERGREVVCFMQNMMPINDIENPLYSVYIYLSVSPHKVLHSVTDLGHCTS